jgi:hypothetical protein
MGTGASNYDDTAASELILNLKTAKKIDLTIPEATLLRAGDITAFFAAVRDSQRENHGGLPR